MRALIRYCQAYDAWAMEPTVMGQMVALFNRHLAGVKLSKADIALAIGRDPDDQHDQSMDVRIQDGIAIIPVRGVIAKYAADVNGVSQPQGSSAETIQAQLKMAESTPGVYAIVLAVCSPGGAVAGMFDAAQAIADVATRIPVVAYVDELCASAAYCLASQCTSIYANQTSLVGSIGVLSRLVDSSAAAEKEGLKIYNLRSAELKAPGMPGDALSKEQIASGQAIVDDFAAMFTATVARGRGMDAKQIAAVSTGQAWVASKAQSLGLIDGIALLDDVLNHLSTGAPMPSPSKTIADSDTTDEPNADADPKKPEDTEDDSETPKKDDEEPAVADDDTDTDADEPPPEPKPKARKNSMKLSAEALTALIEAHPSHAPLIAAGMKAGHDEKTIRASITSAIGANKDATITDLRAKLTASESAHEATRTKLAAAEKRVAGVAAIEGGAPKSVGGDSSRSFDGLAGEALWTAEFNSSAELQEGYALGGLPSYLAFKKREQRMAAKAK